MQLAHPLVWCSVQLRWLVTVSPELKLCFFRCKSLGTWNLVEFNLGFISCKHFSLGDPDLVPHFLLTFPGVTREAGQACLRSSTSTENTLVLETTRTTWLVNRLRQTTKVVLGRLPWILLYGDYTTVDPKQWVDSRRVEEQGQTHDMRKH